jgi:hypothetical protein
MADQWYYAQDDCKLGPFSAQELRALADAGRIQGMDTVWKEGVERGVMAHRVKNLFAPPPAGAFSKTESERPAVAPGPEASGTVVSPEPTPAPTQQDLRGACTEQEEALPAALPTPEKSVAPELSPSLHAAAQAGPGQGQNVPPATDEVFPQEKSLPQAAPKPRAPEVQTKPKGRAISAKGAILMNQNGVTVQFQKQCTECGYLDSSKTTMTIRAGTSRTTFFCRKCRKLRHVEIQGTV